MARFNPCINPNESPISAPPMAAHGTKPSIPETVPPADATQSALRATLVPSKHTKKGHDLFVVQLADRVERPEYERLRDLAQTLDGYYSFYRGKGAVPGFTFTARPNAEQFLAQITGSTCASHVPEHASCSEPERATAQVRRPEDGWRPVIAKSDDSEKLPPASMHLPPAPVGQSCRSATPQVPPMAGMTPLGMKPTSTPNKRDALIAAARSHIKFLEPFIGPAQLEAVTDGLEGEEYEFFCEKLSEFIQLITTMPKSRATDGQGDQAVAHLHYFAGGRMNFYITENGHPTDHAFGLADLHGDGGELGSICLSELTENGAELDFYWTPKTLAEVKGKEERVQLGITTWQEDPPAPVPPTLVHPPSSAAQPLPSWRQRLRK